MIAQRLSFSVRRRKPDFECCGTGTREAKVPRLGRDSLQTLCKEGSCGAPRYSRASILDAVQELQRPTRKEGALPQPVRNSLGFRPTQVSGPAWQHRQSSLEDRAPVTLSSPMQHAKEAPKLLVHCLLSPAAHRHQGDVRSILMH